MRIAVLMLVLLGCDREVVALSGQPDSDGDGLTNSQELELGTDKLTSDTDGDGFDDGFEVRRSTDPLNRFDWPLEQDAGSHHWPDFTAEAPDPTIMGYEIGDAVPELASVDQFGNDVNLYQFYGHVVVIDFTAAWCGPCQVSAEHAMDLWEVHRTDGLMMIHYIQDDDEQDPNSVVDADFQREWADEYDLQFPVVLELGRSLFWGFVGNSSLYEGGIPFHVVLDPELRIRGAFTGSGQEQATLDLVVELLPE